jgi:hypothetical protein
MRKKINNKGTKIISIYIVSSVNYCVKITFLTVTHWIEKSYMYIVEPLHHKDEL